MKTLITFLLVITLGMGAELLGQCNPAYSTYLEGNQVRAIVHNGGDMFWNLTSSPGYEVPVGSDKHSAFASSVWMGGFDGTGQLRLAAQTYRQSGLDYFPGPYRQGGVYDCSGFLTVPLDPVYEGILEMPSGDILFFYNTGFTIWEPGNGNITHKILPSTRFSYQPILLPDGRIFLIGDDFSGNLAPTPTMIIDTANYLATNYITLNHYHYGSSATVMNNGKVLIVGRLGSEVFDPVTNTSANITAPATPRSFHTASLLPNGNVLISGGNRSNLAPLPTTNTLEIYDPVAGTWSAGPNMLNARARHTVTELPTGEFLIAGGTNNSSEPIEFYDPVANTISQGDVLNGKLTGHSALPATNGNVYFFGSNNSLDYLFLQYYNAATGMVDSLGYHDPNRNGIVTQNGNFLVGYGPANNLEYTWFDPGTETFTEFRWQKIWSVSQAEIDQFKADLTNNTVNFANYPDIKTWPAHGDVSAGEDRNLAPFVDVNQNGLYRPLIDGDYPCIKGDRALWWVFNDDGIHTETGAQKMDVQVEVMAYTFDCATRNCPDSLVDYSTFYHYEITNKGSQYLNDTYFGIWLDADIGNFANDYVGSDSSLNLAFSYNGDSIDGGQAGYGAVPPALGIQVLNGPLGQKMTNAMYYENDFSSRGNPQAPDDFYDVMRSRWADGTHLVNNGTNGYSGSGSGPDINFIYPGDGGFCGGNPSGWSEVSAGNQPFDRRIMGSIGGFDIQPGLEVSIDYGVLWAREGNHLQSVCRLKQLADTLQTWWPTTSDTCFGRMVSIDPPQLQDHTEISVFPNPSQGDFQVELPAISRTGGTLSLYNSVGQLIRVETYAAGQQVITARMNSLSEGMYILKITEGEQQWSKKLLINH